MRYSPGDHFIVLNHNGNICIFVTRDCWIESPVRPDWFEILSYDGHFNVHYPNAAAVFSSRRIMRDTNMKNGIFPNSFKTGKWALMFHRNKSWRPKQ